MSFPSIIHHKSPRQLCLFSIATKLQVAKNSQYWIGYYLDYLFCPFSTAAKINLIRCRSLIWNDKVQGMSWNYYLTFKVSQIFKGLIAQPEVCLITDLSYLTMKYTLHYPKSKWSNYFVFTKYKCTFINNFRLKSKWSTFYIG